MLILKRMLPLCFFMFSPAYATINTHLQPTTIHHQASKGRLSMMTKDNFSVLDPFAYQLNVARSQQRANQHITALNHYRYMNANFQIEYLVKRLLDKPYLFFGATGEGDWQPSSSTYSPGAIHLSQDPLYSFDGFDCQTYVQTILALYYSRDLTQFESNLLKIGYGAAGNPNNEFVHYFNRNHFVDGDWNPINQKNGFIMDATSSDLKQYTAQVSATLTRQQFFNVKIDNADLTVRVLNAANGKKMMNRLQEVYSHLDYPHFDSQHVKTSYIPKETIAIKNADGRYIPNQAVLDKIPTPAVIEIVRDPRKWMVAGKQIKEIIGSELTISHMGILYRKKYKKGDVIYHQISCHYDRDKNKVCVVNPVVCQKDHCNELMMSHATIAYPNGYYFYRSENGYVCTPNPPDIWTGVNCNRVVAMPLFAYLTDYQYGSHPYMDNDSILGVHIERLIDPA